MNLLSRPVWIVVLAALLATTSACGDRRTNEQRLQDARVNIENRNYRAAVIDLKNILRAQSDNVAARLALGEVSLQLGDNATAEKELTRARELGASPDDYAIPLANVLMQNRAHAELLAELEPALVKDSAKASVLTAYRALAMLELGSIEEAEGVFDQLIASQPSAEAARLALLGKTRLANRNGNFDAAERLLRRSLDLVPDSAETTLVLGQILLRKDEFAAAEEVFAYGKTDLNGTALEEFMLGAGQIEAQLGQGKNVEAKENATALIKSGRKHPMSRYMLARALVQNGEPEQAAEELRKLVSNFPGYTAAQVLLGAVTLELGDLEQAEMTLVPVVADQPNNSMARRLLAEVRMRQNRPDEAAETLRGGGASDPQSLNMLARAEIGRGEPGSAIALLEESLRQDPANLQTRFALIAAWVSDGQVERAKTMIRELPEDALSPQRREAMLLVADIDRDEIRGSVEQVDELVARWPDDGAIMSIAGGLYAAGGYDDKARALYLRMHEQEPDNIGVITNIARLDMRSGNYDKAHVLFEEYLGRHPDSVPAMLALARIASQKGETERAVRLVKQANETDPEALAPNLLLANTALADDDLEAARRFAGAALKIAPDSAPAHAAMGVIETRSGNLQAAAGSFREAVDAQPDNPRMHYLKGATEAQLEMLNPARNSFRKVLDLDPASNTARRALMILDAKAGDAASAEKHLAELKQREPNSANTFEAEGDLRAEQRRAQDASDAYRKAASIRPTQRLARRDFQLRKAAGLARPLEPLEDWLAVTPEDNSVRLLYAQELQAGGAVAAAIKQYEALLERNAGSPLAMNNLAWLYLQDNGGNASERALDLARRAHEAAPDSTDIADTYGWVLFKTGRTNEARAVLESVLKDDSPAGQPDAAYHLAEVLTELGDQSGARALLTGALSTGRPFYSKSEAQALLNRL